MILEDKLKEPLKRFPIMDHFPIRLRSSPCIEFEVHPPGTMTYSFPAKHCNESMNLDGQNSEDVEGKLIERMANLIVEDCCRAVTTGILYDSPFNGTHAPIMIHIEQFESWDNLSDAEVSRIARGYANIVEAKKFHWIACQCDLIPEGILVLIDKPPIRHTSIGEYRLLGNANNAGLEPGLHRVIHDGKMHVGFNGGLAIWFPERIKIVRV